jgi:hypothetical protein
VPSSRIIDVALGLVFVFGVTAGLSSVVTELIARFLGLRGAYLLRGLRELLDGDQAGETHLARADQEYASAVQIIANGLATTTPADQQPAVAIAAPTATGVLLGGPVLGGHGMTGRISSRTQLTLSSSTRTGRPAPLQASGDRLLGQRRSLPAYISAGSFADAVIDLLVPDATGVTTMTTVEASMAALPDSMAPLRSSLLALAKSAGDDLAVFRSSIEHWYDDHMGRVSGWYKRHVAKITLVVGTVLVLLLNVNAVTIARTLYTDGDVRSAVSTVAAKGQSCPTSQGAPDCLRALETQLADAESSGLPLGWATVQECSSPSAGCSWWQQRGILATAGGSSWRLLLVLLGFVLTITALVPGARFWFDLLSRLGSLRTSGPRPASPSA